MNLPVIILARSSFSPVDQMNRAESASPLNHPGTWHHQAAKKPAFRKKSPAKIQFMPQSGISADTFSQTLPK
jgi:hypothetical protein